jgi:hypothetical protein
MSLTLEEVEVKCLEADSFCKKVVDEMSIGELKDYARKMMSFSAVVCYGNCDETIGYIIEDLVSLYGTKRFFLACGIYQILISNGLSEEEGDKLLTNTTKEPNV